MWPITISRRERDLAYRISKIEENLEPDIKLPPLTSPSGADINENLEFVARGSSFLYRTVRFLSKKFEALSFENVATATGAGVGGYVKIKYPSLLVHVLPEMPEMVSYAVFSAAGATTGRLIPIGVYFGTRKAISAYRSFRENYQVKFGL